MVNVEKRAKIYIAGHRGMVGSGIERKLRAEGYHNILTRASQDLDLRNQSAVLEFFKSENILSPSRIGGARKKSRMKTYSTQSDILATFDFNKLYIPGKPGLVPDTVKSNLPEFWKSKKDSIHDNRYVINKSINSPISHGIMHDSSWVSGRWYNTKALALHERESHILLDLEGKLENLSFHTWLKIGNPELPNSVIFGSPEWNNPGDFLVEFTRSKRKPFLSF